MECRDLLLVGMATSTNLREASVSAKAITLVWVSSYSEPCCCSLVHYRISLLIFPDALCPGYPLDLFPYEKQHLRDVNVGGLSDSLVVDSGVGDDDDSGLLEGLGDVVGEVTWGESAGNGLGTGETSELQDSSVTVWSGRDDTDVVGVVDGGKDSGSKDEFLPGLADVQDVDTWGFGSVENSSITSVTICCRLPFSFTFA